MNQFKVAVYFRPNILTMKYALIVLFASAMLGLSGCGLLGEEVGRVEINQLYNSDNMQLHSTDIQLFSGDQLAIWSEMDLEYNGEPLIRGVVQILNGNEIVFGQEFDPRESELTIGEKRVQLNDHTSWSFSKKNTVFEPQKDGMYTVKCFFMAPPNNLVKVNKAHIVLKK